MEIFVIFTTIIMSLFSVSGFVLNNSLTSIIRNKSESVEEVNVRVNSIPTHQLLKGETDSIQLSLKQWQVTPYLKLDLLELEGDRLKLNLREIKGVTANNWQKALKSPVNIGWRMVMTENDLNKIIMSPPAQSIISKSTGNSSQSDFELLDLAFNLQPNNRIFLDSKIKLPIRGEEILNVHLELSMELKKGHTLIIKDLQGTLNNRQLSSKLLQGFADNINTQLSLRNLEKSGITMRILQLNTDKDKLEIAGFVHLKPDLDKVN